MSRSTNTNTTPTRRISMRASIVAASLLVAGGIGYGFTANAQADRGRSQDPRTWFDANGDVKANNVPNRIAMSTPDFPGGQVFIDPHSFYGELGASADQGLAPVFARRFGGTAVGTYDISTGNIVISADYQHSDDNASARPRTTVATAEPTDSSVPDTADTTDTTVVANP
jgi:hypothetical protein